MPISQVKFLTKFSVDREIVYRLARTGSKDAQCRRRYSLRHGYQFLNERTAQHQWQSPRSAMLSWSMVMTGTCYSKLKPSQTPVRNVPRVYGS